MCFLCVCMWGHVHMSSGALKTRGTGCSRDGVTNVYELPNVGDGN